MTAGLLTVPAAFTPASLDYAALSPLLVVFGFAIVGVLVEAFVPRASRYALQVTLTLVALLAAFVAVVAVAIDHQGQTAGLIGVGGSVAGTVVVDGPALFMQGAVLVLSALSVVIIIT